MLLPAARKALKNGRAYSRCKGGIGSADLAGVAAIRGPCYWALAMA